MERDGEMVCWDFKSLLDIHSLSPGYYRLRMDTRVIPDAMTKTALKDQLEDEGVKSLNIEMFPVYAARLLEAKSHSMNDEFLDAFQVTRHYLTVLRRGDPEPPQAVWTLLARYASESSRGTVAMEDRKRFQFGFRNAFQGPLILPRENEQGQDLIYVLEPDFPLILQDRLPWLDRGLMHGLNVLAPTLYPFDHETGSFQLRLIEPDGEEIDFGSARFRGASLTGATTRQGRYHLQFRKYGTYRAEVKGAMDDLYGFRHTANGTFEFHVGNRITMSTACKPGTPFFVGEKYPPLVEVNPPAPADVRISVRYLPMSDPRREVRHEIRGRANRYGYFFPGDDYTPLVFTEPGEYLSEVFVRYVDSRGIHWYGGQVGGSVIALPYDDAPIMIHGWQPEADKVRYMIPLGSPNMPCLHDPCACNDMFAPFHPGDVAYFFSDPQDISYFEYAVNIEQKEDSLPPRTSVSDPADQRVYIYLSAIRPGFVAVAMVSDGKNLEFHWRPAFDDFGGQRASGPVGDMPDDVYRLMAGAVMWDRDDSSVAYGAYTAAAVTKAPGTYESGVLPPFTMPLFRLADCDYWLLYGVEAGSILEVGDRLALGGSTVPAVPVRCRWEVTKPSGERIIREGDGNDIGRCAPAEPIVEVDEAGVWKMRAIVSAQGVEGYVTGVCDGEFEHYAVEPDAPDLIRIDGAPVSRIAADRPTLIRGRVKATLEDAVIHYTLQFPGTIMDIGDLPVDPDGAFTYRYDPLSFGVEFQNFDVRDIHGGHAGIETVLLSLLLEGTDPLSGNKVHSARKVVIHGDRLIDVAPGLERKNTLLCGGVQQE